MELIRDEDIDPTPLEGRKIAVIGFGNQGRAQALNLNDSGLDVVVGLRPDSLNAAVAETVGLKTRVIEEAVSGADVVMLLIPDEKMAAAYAGIEPLLRQNAALGFSHGLAVHFGLIKPREDLDVFLVAPKGPGTALRSLYRDGKGMIAVWAVAQDTTGTAASTALAYGRGIGCGRIGLIASTFAEEAEADLFNEQAVVWGGVPELLIAGFETLVESGVTPEIAYLECVGELKLLAELIEARGIAGMQEVISNTAEFGAHIGGERIVSTAVRQTMKDVLSEIRQGRFAADLMAEEMDEYPRLSAARASARQTLLEKTFQSLREVKPA